MRICGHTFEEAHGFGRILMDAFPRSADASGSGLPDIVLSLNSSETRLLQQLAEGIGWKQ